MHDFGRLVYLDLQKTGSTFVCHFLNKTCRLPLVREIKHGVIGEEYNPEPFYFMSVRHPVAQYSSLFRYGLDKRGGLYRRLARLGHDHLYENTEIAYNKWLRFVLDPRNSRILNDEYGAIASALNIGLLTFRYLRLSLVSPMKALREKPELVDLETFARERSIVNYMVYCESLNDNLWKLAREIRPSYFDREKVEQFLSQHDKINASTRGSEETPPIDDEVRQLLSERERILLNVYNEGLPTSCGRST